MKRKRYTEEQIIRILQEIETGKTVAETCREYNVSESAVYRWRQKYRGMNRSELRRAVNKALTLKFSPELRFRIDETFDRLDTTRALFSRDDVRRDLSED